MHFCRQTLGKDSSKPWDVSRKETRGVPDTILYSVRVVTSWLIIFLIPITPPMATAATPVYDGGIIGLLVAAAQIPAVTTLT